MANYIYQDARVEKKASLLSQTFLWVMIGLLVTSVFTVGLAWLVSSMIASGNEAGLSTYLTFVGLSGFIQLILVFVIQIGVIRKGPTAKNITVPYLIYAANMGIVMSALALVLSFEVLGLALLITIILFAMMSLFAKQTKRNLSPLLMIGTSILVGALILTIVNLFVASSQLDWILSFVLLGAIMLITLFDIWQVMKVSETGETNSNLARFFAFSIYIDFIYIIIRIAYFIGLSRRN